MPSTENRWANAATHHRDFRYAPFEALVASFYEGQQMPEPPRPQGAQLRHSSELRFCIKAQVGFAHGLQSINNILHVN